MQLAIKRHVVHTHSKAFWSLLHRNLLRPEYVNTQVAVSENKAKRRLQMLSATSAAEAIHVQRVGVLSLDWLLQ